MKTIIVEDNPAARQLLETLIKQYCPDLILLGVAKNVEEGKELIQRCKPELVFLDIELPNDTGFGLLENLDTIDFQIIITTAYEKYALTAIKFSALDYLLKPIVLEDLLEAVRKVKEVFKKDDALHKVHLLLHNLENNQPKKLLLKDRYGIQIIEVDSILRLEAQGSYTRFFVEGNKNYMSSERLGKYEKLLDSLFFFRVHQSHLVHLKHISRYDKKNGFNLIMKDDSKVPVSRRKHELLMGIINKLLLDSN